MTVLAFAHVAFFLYGFLGVIFTHDFWFTVGATFIVTFMLVYAAHFLETSPTISYVFHVRYGFLLFMGASIGSLYVHAFRLRKLVDMRVLQSGRKYPCTFLGFMTIFLVFFALMLATGIFYILGFYDEPTLGLGINDGTEVKTILGPLLTGVSAVVIVLILYGMAAKETSGLGAMTAKYLLALVVLVAVPVALYDLGAEPNQALTPPSQGFVAIGTLIVLWGLFYFYATAGTFTLKARSYNAVVGKIRDPLFRQPRRTARFVIGIGFTHVLVFLIGWIVDDASGKDLHIMFYAALGIGAVVGVIAVFGGIITRAWQDVSLDSSSGVLLKTKIGSKNKHKRRQRQRYVTVA